MPHPCLYFQTTHSFSSLPQNWLPPLHTTLRSYCDSLRLQPLFFQGPSRWLKAFGKHTHTLTAWDPLFLGMHPHTHTPKAQSSSDFRSPRLWVCLIDQLCFFLPHFKYRPLSSLGSLSLSLGPLSDLPTLTSVEGIASTFTFQGGMTPTPGCVA